MWSSCQAFKNISKNVYKKLCCAKEQILTLKGKCWCHGLCNWMWCSGAIFSTWSACFLTTLSLNLKKNIIPGFGIKCDRRVNHSKTFRKTHIRSYVAQESKCWRQRANLKWNERKCTLFILTSTLSFEAGSKWIFNRPKIPANDVSQLHGYQDFVS